MKKLSNIYFNKIIILLLLAVATISCNDDKDPVFDGTYAKAAAFTVPEKDKSYILDEENKYDEMDAFKWTASAYSIPIGMRYTIEIDLEEGDFSNPVKLITTEEREVAFTINDFNTALASLDLAPGVENKIKMRLVTQPYGGEEGNVLLESYPIIHSDPITIFVTPFEPPKPAYPPTLYMIGDEFGGWNWESDGIVSMIPVHGKEGQFWCINYFSANKGFKWAPERKWANDFAVLDQKIGYTESGGNAIVEADGLYMVYIDMTAGKIAIETAKIYGIGDCFGGWTATTYPFTITGDKASITTTASGNVRMYAESSIQTTDWWTREFNVFDGKIVYRGTGNDQEAVPVAAGVTVTLDFKAGTGTIK
jgi:hypothetical protein